MAVFRICILLFVYFEIPRNVGADVAEVKGSTPIGFKSRDTWKAKNYSNTEQTDLDKPLQLVIIYDTWSRRCHRFILCAAEMRRLQTHYHGNYNYDIAYNFLIGSDGRVYEGRGWKVAGAHTEGYNRCSLGLAFVGDYSEDWNRHDTTQVTELQQQRAQLLFEEGIILGYLSPNFHVLGAQDLRKIYRPGENLFRAIRGWSNYDHENRYKNRTCDEIQQL